MANRYRDGRYAAQNPSWHEEDASEKAEGIARMLTFAGVAPRSVVDVGCGAGGVLRHLKHRFDRVWPHTSWEGWDIAGAAIGVARRHEGGRLRYVEGDFLQSERHGDVLLCVDVIEHVPDDVAFLEALRGRASTFVFRIPLDLSVLDVARPAPRLLRVGPQYGHRALYTRELALQRVEAAGYRIIADRYHRVAPTQPGLLGPCRALGGRFAPHWTARLLGGFSLILLAEARHPQPRGDTASRP